LLIAIKTDKNCTVKLNWIHLETVSSTNSYLQEIARGGDLPEGTIVTADFQELGRGQGEHAWQSEKEQNLLMSLLLYPEFLSASRQFQLSMMTSLAVCDTLYDLDIHPMIKWPNDILTTNGKIAGILIEHAIMGGQLSHSVIGIGLNVNQLRFPPFPVRATSLAREHPGQFDVKELSVRLAGHIVSRYHNLQRGAEEPYAQEYLDRLFALNRPLQFKSAEKEFTGVIRGITEFGELQVEVDGTSRVYGMHTLTYSL
jgi:BirA family biotin operon repressor/biotin-[acetyl-CoA-carboxylase] ligase